MASRRALITGVTGQDGSYLAELLVSKGYEVFGVVRRLSSPNMAYLGKVLDKIQILDADLMDQTSLHLAVKRAEPDEVYNLAAQSFVAASFSQPVLTGEITGLGAVRLLEAVRAHAAGARVYQASSSEMFGHVDREPQDETTPFHPRSPYGVAKVYAYWACINYRESYGMYISNGILFNHESERRGLEFVTRRISDGVARIATGKAKSITLGNLDARRDWGYAPDYVDFMWRTLQQPAPGDYVGATGESHSVRDFAKAAFAVAGLTDWEQYVKNDPALLRPSEVFNLRGEPAKAERVLGWRATVRLHDLVRIMVESDLRRHRAASA
ncbi:MAG TPA: GDP-mannose 4,6-dehydratase [Thermoplasmata archaeon]|nr:GDP-mannose 4,6-dehydratase [Thermoplasmata archaeon]